MEGKKKLLLVIGSLLSVIVITAGVSFALFNYIKLGSTENSVTTGTITFLYTEVDKVGAGIKLENAIPITDTAGKMLTGSSNVFNFKVTSTNKMNAAISYEVTARMKADSTLDKDVVKVYLTKGETEEELLLDKYSNLTQTERVNENIAVEKTIYNGRVPSNTGNYEENFKLRMWIDSETDFSGIQDEEGNTVYPYNNKTFTLTVNVYADAKVVTQEEIDMDNTTNIENVVVNNNNTQKVENEEYDYYQELAIEEKEANIEVETTNKDATVEVTKLNNETAYNQKSKIERLSTRKTITLQLDEGDNLFNIKIISANKQVEDEYILKITTKDKTTPSVSGSLEGKVLTITYSDNVGVTSYVVSTSETTPTSGWTEIESSKEGTLNYTLPDVGTYYIYVKDKEGNISKTEGSFTPVSSLYYPKVSASLSGEVITINYSDDFGVTNYIVTTSTTAPSSGWLNITTNQKSGSVQYTTTSSETYYVYVKNTLGYVTKATGSFTPASNLFCTYSAGDVVATFDYTGSAKQFTVPCDGTYKLEVWGAQGGYGLDSTNSRGGYGGYSRGNITLKTGNKLNIAVGGKGIDAVKTSRLTLAGGYNGGGSSTDDGNTGWGSGGGATHITLGNTNRGVLSKYSNYKSEILIVAGGGGGGGSYSSYRNTGGHAGGYIGGNGTGQAYGTGGSQTAAGTGNGVYKANGGFGYGGGGTTASGGGGGYYGGGTGYEKASGAGGGSSYIGNSLLTDKVMYCYNCTQSSATSTKTISTTKLSASAVANYAKTGNGYAKITLISLD